MQHAWDRFEIYTRFRSRNLMVTDHLEDVTVDGRIILKKILKRYDGRVWTGFVWLRTGTSGRPLWTWDCTFRFYKMLRIS
jgi:hypothetical protein